MDGPNPLSLNISLEDEGYTSPIEVEDDGYFNYNPQPLPLKLNSSLVLEPDRRTIPINENDIPWDEIANSPCEPSEQSTWDNLKPPDHLRYPDHIKLATKGLNQRTHPPCLLDSHELSVKVVDSLWKVQKKEVSHPVSKLQESFEKPIYIPLKTFIQHCFHLLSGRNSTTFPFNSKSNEFIKNPSIIVHGLSPTSLWNYSESLIQCANIVKRYNHYSSILFDNKMLKDEGLEQSAVKIAFLKFTANYLKIYQTILMLNEASIRTLTGLLKLIEPFKQQLLTIDWLFKSDEFGSAVGLLSKLNSLMFCQQTPYIDDLTRTLFVTCASAYLKYVSDWIFRGDLGPKTEFHIEKLRANLYRDRRFWTKQFSHSHSNISVPVFMKKSVQLISETGKAINLLKQIQSENIFSTLPLFCSESEEFLSPCFNFDDITLLYSTWENKLRDFNSQQSYLISDISSSIKELISSSSYSIQLSDSNPGDSNVDIKRQHLLNKKEQFEKHRKKQKEFMSQLQEQVLESKSRKLKESEVEAEEDLRNQKFLLMRDKRDEDEDKRMRLKHFGDENIRVPDNTLFNRIHGVCSNSTFIARVGDGVDGYSSPCRKDSTADGASESDANIVSLDLGCGDRTPTLFLPFQHPVDEDNTNDETIAFEIENLDLDSAPSVLEEEKEKFNPDKIKTRDPPPYSTQISLQSTSTTIDLSHSQLSFLNFPPPPTTTTTEDECNEDPCCINQFLSESITIPLNAQSSMVNSALLHYFICDKKLFYHIEALNNFMCLQNGLFAHCLTEMLIEEVNSKNFKTCEDISRKIGRLNVILSEAISASLPPIVEEKENEFLRNLSFIFNSSFNMKNKNRSRTGAGESKSTEIIHSNYEILDAVHLSYSVQWPLNIVLTEEIFNNYERLFVFLMQLSRAELLLQQSYVSLKNNKAKNSKQLFLLHHYLSRLQHFVRTVRNYVNVTVIQCTWNELVTQFEKLDSLEKIYNVLVRHIKTIISDCLLGSKGEGVMKLLSNQLITIESFCSQLQSLGSLVVDGQEISNKEIQRLQQKFKVFEEIGKVFIDVAYKVASKRYYPKISYLLELYNFNGFFQQKNSAI